VGWGGQGDAPPNPNMAVAVAGMCVAMHAMQKNKHTTLLHAIACLPSFS